MTAVWNDPRVARGNQLMLGLRRERLAGGDRPIGWKVAFGARPAQERFGISGALVGFLTSAGVLADGATVNVDGWIKPAVEPEIAVYLGSDLAGDATREQVSAAVVALGPAIEIADVNPDLAEVEALLADDLYQRHVILGPRDPSRAGGDARGITARITVDGDQHDATDDPTAFCGDLIDTVQHTAGMLASAGERLRAGDIVIAGSVVPLIWPQAGQRVGVELPPLGSLSVSFTQREEQS